MEVPIFHFCIFKTPNMKECHAPSWMICTLDITDQMHLCNMMEGEFECMIEAIKGEMFEEAENLA